MCKNKLLHFKPFLGSMLNPDIDGSHVQKVFGRMSENNKINIFSKTQYNDLYNEYYITHSFNNEYICRYGHTVVHYIDFILSHVGYLFKI